MALVCGRHVEAFLEFVVNSLEGGNDAVVLPEAMLMSQKSTFTPNIWCSQNHILVKTSITHIKKYVTKSNNEFQVEQKSV